MLRLFQRQVLFQCRVILMATGDLNEGLTQRDHTVVFYALQNILNAAANISKACWGQKGKYAAEREPLRSSLGITDASPFKDVDMRNNFEHFDERLDRWSRESRSHVHVDFNLGSSRGRISGIDESIDVFREYDPVTHDLIFWGQSFNIQALVDEVSRILPTAEVEADRFP
jgi:hypothetical protein